MKRFFLSVLLFVFVISCLIAQDDICIGKQYEIHSEILSEDRKYQVYLPESYQGDDAKTYPVIYLIDGEMYFHILTAMHRSYSCGRYPLMPESIIVGIVSTCRTRDLTPTASAYWRDGTRKKDDKETGGGADDFARFIIEELRARIDENYNTNGINTLIGHSYGGLFTLSIFTSRPESFEAYIALDPSLWWDNGKLAKDAGSTVEREYLNNRKLYIGMAGKMRKGVQSIHQKTLDTFIHQTLPEWGESGLVYYTRFFPDENHGSVIIPALTDAFKQLYTNKK